MNAHPPAQAPQSAFAAGFKGCLGAVTAMVVLFLLLSFALATCSVIGDASRAKEDARKEEAFERVCQPAANAYAHYMIYHTAFIAVGDCRRLGQTTLTVPVEHYPRLALTITLQNTEPATISGVQATIEQRLDKRKAAWEKAWNQCVNAGFTSTSKLQRNYTPRLPKSLRGGKAVTLDTATLTVRELETDTEAQILAESQAEQEAEFARRKADKLEEDMLRYHNNGNALAVLGSAAVCLSRCYEHKLTTYTMVTRDGRHEVTITLPNIDGDVFNSASEDIWGERHDALLNDNRQIISGLRGRKLREFRHLEAQATELPFGGRISLSCGGEITIRSIR